MSYIRAEKILPAEVLELIQTYVDGEYLYIPRKQENKKSWGQNTSIKRSCQKETFLYTRIIYKV